VAAKAVGQEKGRTGLNRAQDQAGEGSLASLCRVRLSEAGLSAHGCAERDQDVCGSAEQVGITSPLTAGHSKKE
jgi:hypothetical protein